MEEYKITYVFSTKNACDTRTTTQWASSWSELADFIERFEHQPLNATFERRVTIVSKV